MYRFIFIDSVVCTYHMSESYKSGIYRKSGLFKITILSVKPSIIIYIYIDIKTISLLKQNYAVKHEAHRRGPRVGHDSGLFCVDFNYKDLNADQHITGVSESSAFGMLVSFEIHEIGLTTKKPTLTLPCMFHG